jgi:hypothetical protein
MSEYTKAVFNEEALRAFAREPYYSEKDREKDTRELIKQVARDNSLEGLARIFGIPLEQVKKIVN